MIKKYYTKYKELFMYGLFGGVTVLINLLLYKLFLMAKFHYVVASILSYFIASLVSYFFNVFFVFNSEKLKMKNEFIRLLKYFSVRIGSVVIDTLLLILVVEVFKIDEFYAKIMVSVVVILLTYILNRKILKRKGVKWKT